MTNRLLAPLGASALLLSALTTGCQSPHTDSVLLKKDPGSSVVYRAPGEHDIPYATNVVHVPRDARFSLNLEAINPGWIHHNSSLLSDSSSTLAGKDLWLLIRVRTLSSGGGLDAESKTIVRASLVKHDMRSFGLIPLTLDEVTPFALEANADYEVSLRLYELKKDFTRASLDARPGLSGVARTAWAATTDTFKSVVGDRATRAWGDDADIALPVERRVLDAGGELRFESRFAIYRDDDTLAPRHPDDDARGRTLVNRYLLTDPRNRRTSDRRDPAKDTRYTDAATYLEHVENLENAEIPGRQDAFLRFRVEAMWSPVAQALARIQSAPARPDNVSQEQALAAESLAATARDTFLKAAEDEKQAGLAAADALRKSDGANPAQLDETARALARKTQEVAAARAAMETAQARAAETRQAVEATASRRAQTANAEKTAALADAALVQARRVTDAAIRELDATRAALEQTRAAAENARLKKEDWMQAETRDRARLDQAREELADLSPKAAKSPGDEKLRQKLADAERTVADATRAVDTASAEWKLAQKDQEAKLNAAQDLMAAVAQKRLAVAEAEAEKQRALAAKDQADAVLNGADASDPRPAILRAPGL